MGRWGAQSGGAWRDCCCRSVLPFLLRSVLYALWISFARYTDIWAHFNEAPEGWECEHQPLPANHSGIRVIVAGFMKTGTRTMSRVLWQLGMEHSYHSEDFGHYFWSRYRDNYWLQKHGGSWKDVPAVASYLNPGNSDREVLNAQGLEKLAAGLSRCRIDALAFDGIEGLIKPIYAISPGAKVLVLDWRTYEQWRKSTAVFLPELMAEIYILSAVFTASQALPWRVVVRAMERFFSDWELEQALKSGGPPVCQHLTPTLAAFHGAVANRRIASMWFSGNHLHPYSKEEYYHYYKTVSDSVPEGDLMHFDMGKHTFDDLCGFLGISPCPRSGRIPRARNNFIFQRDFPMLLVFSVPSELFLHWLNWLLLGRLLAAAAWLCRSRRAKGKAD